LGQELWRVEMDAGGEWERDSWVSELRGVIDASAWVVPDVLPDQSYLLVPHYAFT